MGYPVRIHVDANTTCLDALKLVLQTEDADILEEHGLVETVRRATGVVRERRLLPANTKLLPLRPRLISRNVAICVPSTLSVVQLDSSVLIHFNVYVRMMLGTAYGQLRFYVNASTTVNQLTHLVKESLGLTRGDDRFALFGNYASLRELTRLVDDANILGLRDEWETAEENFFQFQVIPDKEDQSYLGAVIKGYLYKEVGTTGFKYRTRRFFALKGTSLFYYKNAQSLKELGEIRNIDQCQIQMTDHPVRVNTLSGFKVHYEIRMLHAKKEYVLSSDDRITLEDWLTALKKKACKSSISTLDSGFHERVVQPILAGEMALAAKAARLPHAPASPVRPDVALVVAQSAYPLSEVVPPVKTENVATVAPILVKPLPNAPPPSMASSRTGTTAAPTPVRTHTVNTPSSLALDRLFTQLRQHVQQSRREVNALSKDAILQTVQQVYALLRLTSTYAVTQGLVTFTNATVQAVQRLVPSGQSVLLAHEALRSRPQVDDQWARDMRETCEIRRAAYCEVLERVDAQCRHLVSAAKVLPSIDSMPNSEDLAIYQDALNQVQKCMKELESAPEPESVVDKNHSNNDIVTINPSSPAIQKEPSTVVATVPQAPQVSCVRCRDIIEQDEKLCHDHQDQPHHARCFTCWECGQGLQDKSYESLDGYGLMCTVCFTPAKQELEKRLNILNQLCAQKVY